MQYVLSAYAVQGVTGVRFQFNTQASPSTAFDGSFNVRSTWVRNLANFFTDLRAYGITNITPAPSWDDYGAIAKNIEAQAGYQVANLPCVPYPNTPGCPTLTSCPAPKQPNTASVCPEPASYCTTTVNGSTVLGKHLVFTPLQPYAVDPNDGNNPDGMADLGNSAWACSPPNTGFAGWDKVYNLIDSIGCAAATPVVCAASQQAAQSCTAPVTAACGSPDPATGITIEEVDMQNEVELEVIPTLGRMIYDNTNNNPSTGASGVPVFQYIGGALAKHGYNAGAVTVSVDVPRPADTTAPYQSIYGDAAQMLDSSELLAATGGYPFGIPFGDSTNGELTCGGATTDTNPNDQPPLPSMISAPSQPTPTVTDMHAKPRGRRKAPSGWERQARGIAHLGRR
jgi:hypothetical protein